jgi:DNA-binding HxlR family transcriptional regulator
MCYQVGGLDVFVPEKELKNLVISYVRREERSISALARELQKDGFKLHRLFLTGYLRALADMGVVKEKRIPPAKVYTTSARTEKNIYQSVGEVCSSLLDDDKERGRLAVSVLQRLFHRPIFLQEIYECGLGDIVVASRVTGEERAEARKALFRNGVKLPAKDPAYLVEDPDPEQVDEVVCQLLLEKFRSQHLVLDTVQLRLHEI